jgi:hypothetical protein
MGAAAPALADCRSDLLQLEARLKTVDPKSPNLGPAKKEYAKAVEQQKDELACDNAVTRTWRALRKPLPEPKPDNDNDQ